MASGDAIDLIRRRIQTYSADEHAFKTPVKKLAVLFNRAVANRQSDSLFMLGPPGPGKTFLIDRAQELLESGHIGLKDDTHANGFSHRISIHRATVNCHLHSDAPEKCVEWMILELLGNSHATPKAADNLKKLMRTLTTSTTDNTQDDVDHNESDDGISSRIGKKNQKLTAVRTKPVYQSNISAAETKSYDLILLVIENIEVLLMQTFQVILYELLDRSKQFQPPVVLIGLSDRLDLMEAMEKRLRSRFSQRQVVPACSYVRDVNHFMTIVDDMLSYNDFNRGSAQIISSLLPSSTGSGEKSSEVDLNQIISSWNLLIGNIMASRKTFDVLEKLFYLHGNDFPFIRLVLEQAVQQLRADDSRLSNGSNETARVGTNSHVESFTQAIEQCLEDEMLAVLTGTSLVQFIAFLSAVQHVITAPQKTLTITVLADICQNQFVTVKLQASAMSRPSIIEAVKQLIDIGLLVLDDAPGREKTVQERIPLRVALSRSQLVEFSRDKAVVDRMQLPLAVQHMLRELVRTVENGRGVGGTAGGNMAADADSRGEGGGARKVAFQGRDDADRVMNGRHAGYVAGFAVGK